MHARLNDDPLKTVFFGGGTPSLIPPPLLSRILDTVHECYGIHSAAEISMEADPGTFDTERICEYQRLGVNRFSVGVQAFDEVCRLPVLLCRLVLPAIWHARACWAAMQPIASRVGNRPHLQELWRVQELLQACGRSHCVADVHAAIESMHAAAPSSWSLDLIAGLPGLTLEGWQNSLDCAVAAGPPHVSVYDLQVRHHTTRCQSAKAQTPFCPSLSGWQLKQYACAHTAFPFQSALQLREVDSSSLVPEQATPG